MSWLFVTISLIMLSEEQCGVCGVAQQVRTLTAKSDDLSLIPGTYIKNQFLSWVVVAMT